MERGRKGYLRAPILGSLEGEGVAHVLDACMEHFVTEGETYTHRKKPLRSVQGLASTCLQFQSFSRSTC